MINAPFIIITIGNEYYERPNYDRLEELVSYGISHFRFNLSRFININDFHLQCELIKNIKNHFGQRIEIMIDLAYPGEKVRIFNKYSDYKTFAEKEHLLISSIDPSDVRNDIKTFYTNIPMIGKYVSVGQKLIYADGEHILEVIKISDDMQTIAVQVDKECNIFSRKSISIGKIMKNRIPLSKIASEIEMLIPDSIALSFVESAQDILILRKKFTNRNIEIYSKIETLTGINNINEISKYSNIIVGRGDLLLNIEPHKLLDYQNQIISAARKDNKKIIVSTGILTSMINNYLPTQAELIDIANIIKSNVSGFVLNFGLVRSDNIYNVLQLLNKIIGNYRKV